MPILVDTNVLLRTKEPSHAQCTPCQQVLTVAVSRGELLVLCDQVIVEYWASATRPKAANGLGLTPEGADRDLAAFEAALVRLPDPPSLTTEWRQIVRTHAVLGRQAYDARLAAFMRAGSIGRLLTLNAGDFARYPFVACVSPTALLAEYGA